MQVVDIVLYQEIIVIHSFIGYLCTTDILQLLPSTQLSLPRYDRRPRANQSHRIINTTTPYTAET